MRLFLCMLVLVAVGASPVDAASVCKGKRVQEMSDGTRFCRDRVGLLKLSNAYASLGRMIILSDKEAGESTLANRAVGFCRAYRDEIEKDGRALAKSFGVEPEYIAITQVWSASSGGLKGHTVIMDLMCKPKKGLP